MPCQSRGLPRQSLSRSRGRNRARSQPLQRDPPNQSPDPQSRSLPDSAIERQSGVPQMKLNHGLHLAYCTNVHRGETWTETFDALKRYTLAVRQRVCPDQPYAIGLRLSQQAAKELSDRATLLEFQRWLAQNHCYVFTINGFPFGQFHGKRVKEQVYQP